MDLIVQQWQLWLTLIGAVIAGITGVLGLSWQFADRRARFILRAGPAVASIDHRTSLYVVNVGKVPIEIADYGVVLVSGSLFSFPIEFDMGEQPDGYSSKNTSLGPHERFEAGLDIPGRVAGVYCSITTRKRIEVEFFRETGWYERTRLSWAIWRRGYDAGSTR